MLTSATSHFTDVGVVADSLPLDPGLMTLTCATNDGAPFDCTRGPLMFDVGDTVEITWSGRFKSDDPEIEALVISVYESGLAALAEQLSN